MHRQRTDLSEPPVWNPALNAVASIENRRLKPSWLLSVSLLAMSHAGTCLAQCAVTTVSNSSVASPLPAGTQVQLTAHCVAGQQPITYTWSTGAVGPVIVVAPPRTTTYSVTPANSQGTGNPFSVTVYIYQSDLPLPPSACVITQTPNTEALAVPAGTPVTLSLTCSGGGVVTSCSWNNGINSASCVVNILLPRVPTFYAVSPSNPWGSGPPVTTLVNGVGVPPVPVPTLGHWLLLLLPFLLICALRLPGSLRLHGPN